MPVYYSSGTAAPTLQWFNKYVVNSVTERDPVSQADSSSVPAGLDIGFDQVTSYTYSGGGAWRYNDSPLVKTKYRTWGEWRGFGKITTIAGAGTTKEVDETLYFRGMNGDRATTTGGTKTVTVTDSTGGSWPDDDWLAGAHVLAATPVNLHAALGSFHAFRRVLAARRFARTLRRDQRQCLAHVETGRNVMAGARLARRALRRSELETQRPRGVATAHQHTHHIHAGPHPARRVDAHPVEGLSLIHI